MLGMLAQKQQLADGVLDGRGDLKAIKMPSGHAAFLERLESLMDMKAEAVVSRPLAGPSPEITENPYEAFRDGMAARMAGRLLSLELCQNEDQSTILVVLDGPVDQSKHLTDRLLRESFSKSKDIPSLEMMDRSTYETIRRLAGAGFLKMDKESTHKFHSSPAFDDQASTKKDRSLKEAKKIFSQAERKMLMSSVLTEGGFPMEALTPLSQAVELALKASAYLAGEIDVEGNKDLPLSRIQSRIIASGFLPDNAVAIVASLRESIQQLENLDENTAINLIQSSRNLIHHVNQALNKSALG
jgi:hypothetical protein